MSKTKARAGNGNQEGKGFDSWAILELMGHRRLAGRVSEQVVSGIALLRIDVPAVNGTKEFTQFYHPNSLYSLTPTTEKIARAMAAHLHERPVQQYELPQLKAAEGKDSYNDDGT